MSLALLTRLEITPTGGALGAFVSGFDARTPQPEQILQLKQALRDHQALIFQDQRLSEEELVDFGTLFGSIFVPPAEIPVLGSADGALKVVTIANAQGGYLGHGEVTPHSDHHWTPYPSSGSLLLAQEVPAQGGETWWINLIRAYDALEESLKTRIADLKLLTYNPFLRKGSGPFDRSLQPPHLRYAHPLVRTHPESGKKILYLSPAYDAEIVGLDAEESDELVERLRTHILRTEFAYAHPWKVGDIVYWDNQATVHYRKPFDEQQRRILKRVSIAGGRPF